MSSAEVIVVQNKDESQPGLNHELSPDQCLTKVMGIELHPSTLKDKFLFATFQIIAEHGADSLSANELIRKTESSKGALFHHFKTLDELCLESLRFLRKNGRLSIDKEHNSLQEFLDLFVSDITERFSSKAYFHIVHFFRDRALKEEKFKQVLNELYSVYVDGAVEHVMKYVSPNADRNKVRELVIFMYTSLERTSYRLLTSAQPADTQEVVNWFVKMIESRLKTY